MSQSIKAPDTWIVRCGTLDILNNILVLCSRCWRLPEDERPKDCDAKLELLPEMKY